jgi:hypothetical protein
LTNRRVAAILRNSRHAARYFGSTLEGLTGELRFSQGLYVTLAGERRLDDKGARHAAAKMSDDLQGPVCRFGTPAASALILLQPNGVATARLINTVFASRCPIFPHRSGGN